MKKEQIAILKDADKFFKNNHKATLKFKIDGFKVTICHELANNRLRKVIYINEEVKGVWFDNLEHEETKRFAYYSSHYVNSKRWREAMRRLGDKEGLDEKYERHSFFTGASILSIVKQWIGREINKNITLLNWNTELGDYEQVLKSESL